jgi:pimeloyl-ACP methyl ester carboxylesterase
MVLFFGCYTVGCQQGIGKYSCNCSKIGIDSIWADTNKVSCYLIPVEKNFSEPRGENYLLAVASAPSLSSSPKESLLYLHGGPGIATLSNLPRYLKSKTFSLLRQDHDLVFFDYRGTGFSEPVLCKTLSYSLEAISDTISLEERITKEASLYSFCKANLLDHGVHLSDFSSLQSAADAETIRKELGINEFVIYSVSHGTTVALNMMRTFPKYINSVILDSPFPPNAPWLDFVRPFDTCFKILEKTISRDSAYSKLFPSIRNDFVKISDKLRKSPFIMSLKKGTDSSLHPSLFSNNDFAWSVWTAMLDPYYIRLVPLALKEIASGNDSVLLQWALVFNDPNSFGEFALAQSKAILGYETKPRFEEETENYLLKNFPEYGHFIKQGLDSSINAVYRPEVPPNGYFNAVESNIPTLIIAGEYDPVCPPLFAYVTSKTLPNSTVMIVPSASHAALFVDECTRTIGAQFYLFPEKKPSLECLTKRKQIEFVTRDILSELK